MCALEGLGVAFEKVCVLTWRACCRQHRISSVPPPVLMELLTASGHEPKLVDIP